MLVHALGRLRPLGLAAMALEERWESIGSHHGIKGQQSGVVRQGDNDEQRWWLVLGRRGDMDSGISLRKQKHVEGITVVLPECFSGRCSAGARPTMEKNRARR
jgi:hypothetical protein